MNTQKGFDSQSTANTLNLLLAARNGRYALIRDLDYKTDYYFDYEKHDAIHTCASIAREMYNLTDLVEGKKANGFNSIYNAVYNCFYKSNFSSQSAIKLPAKRGSKSCQPLYSKEYMSFLLDISKGKLTSPNHWIIQLADKMLLNAASKLKQIEAIALVEPELLVEGFSSKINTLEGIEHAQKAIAKDTVRVQQDFELPTSHSDALFQLAAKVKQAEELAAKVEAVEKQNQVLVLEATANKEKVSFADAVINNNKNYSMASVANNLIGKGNITLYRRLRELKIVVKSGTKPMQRYLNSKFFVTGVDENGYDYTRVTAKGYVWLAGKLGLPKPLVLPAFDAV